MNIIYNMLTTREWATVIWIFLIILFILFKKDIRKALVDLINILFSKWIRGFILSIVIYTVVITFLLSRCSFWDWLYLKDVLIWIITCGFFISINAVDNKSDEFYIKNVLKENIKWIMIVEFFFSTFTFNLMVEILLLPFITIISLLEYYCTFQKGKEYEITKKFLSGVLTLTGFVMLYNTVKVAIINFDKIDYINLFINFFFPIIYLFLFIPFEYFWELFSKYQTLFCRLTISFNNDKKKFKLKYRFLVLKVCGLSVRNVMLFQRAYFNKHYFNMDEEKFNSLVEEFYKLKK